MKNRIFRTGIIVLIWLKAKNFFIAPMNRSVENAHNIITYVRNATYELRTSDPLMNDNYNDIQPWYLTMEDFVAERTEDKQGQFAFTDDVKLRFKDMKPKLEHFQDVFRGIFGKKTTEYRSIWGRNLERFYHGPYVVRANAVKALSTGTRTLGGAPLIALADEMIAYFDDLSGLRTSQQGKIALVKTDSTNIKSTVDSAATELFQIYGRTILMYAKKRNFETLIASIFPTSLFDNHPNAGHYPMIISAGTLHRICILNDKEGKQFMINMIDSLSDVLLTYSDDSEHAGTGGYIARMGLPVVMIDPPIIGDVTKKFIIGTCLSPIHSAHFTFDIVAKQRV